MKFLPSLTSFLCCLTGTIVALADDTPPVARPNILWISVEDISPDLGCYGDKHAVTPTIDRLAAEGVRFTRCFTHAGVCAPSRSGLITGCYPPSIGTHHMRCKGVPPDDVRCFPEYLRLAGYYCTNNVKTDYQFEVPATAWDENSNKADWRGRDKGQPFFSVINFTTTHESQIRDPSPATKKLVEKLSPEQRHDPAKMIVPPFYPDTLIVRRDIANYYDNITAVDGQVAAVLKRLKEDGLAEDTIVWFWGDHGRGMPRYKRWLYDTGLHVPLVVRVPERWRKHVRPDNADALKPGSTIDDLTAFVDFAPTVLSLAGLPEKPHFQGQAFFGPHRVEAPREFVYGHRDRMDETYDLIRTVRDKRFRYVRNFMPWQPYSQDIAYMNEMPTMQEWRRLHAEGRLTIPQANWFRQKPLEELYDTETDPYEINNLAANPMYARTLERLRGELGEWMGRVGDVGLIPESILDELQHPRGKQGQTATPGARTVYPMSPTIDQAGKAMVMLDCPGASVVYRVVSQAKDARPDRWRLFPDQGVLWLRDETIEIKACHLGLKDSDVVRYKVGQGAIDSTWKDSPPHWRGVMDRAEVLEPLRRLCFGDNNPARRLDDCFDAAGDNSPVVRYWAAVELGQRIHGPARARIVETLRTLASPDSPPAPSGNTISRRTRGHENVFSNPSPAVRIAAARGLCEVEDPARYLPVFVEYLSHPQASVQLQAITALAELGEKARPVIDDIRKATKSGEYVGRVSERALKHLEGR